MPDPSPLSDAQAQRLIKLYSEAEAEILGEINRLLMGQPKDYSLAWQRTILQRVQQIKADLLKGSRTWCQEAIPASYMQGVAWADKDPLSGQEVKAGFGSIHQQAVEVLADNAYSRLEDVANVVGRRVNDVYRQISLEAVKGSVIGYKTTAQAAKRIREDLAAHGITGFVDKAGHNWNMRRYAKVLAQETTNGAFRQGTINRLQEKGHDLVRISSHAGSCKLCQPYQGQTFSLTGEDEEFPALSSAKGLFHVGCLHVISLAPEEKDRFIGRLQGKEGAAVREAEIKRLAEKAGWKEESRIKPTAKSSSKSTKWAPFNSVDDAKQQFKGQVLIDEGIDKKLAMQTLNAIGKEHHNLIKKFKQLEGVKIQDLRMSKDELEEIKAMGCWRDDDKQMLIRFDSSSDSAREWQKRSDKMKGIRGSTIADAENIFRHEFGHAAYQQLLTESEQFAIRDAFLDLNESALEKAVSRYATSDPDEAFAEMFNLMAKGKKLPSDLYPEAQNAIKRILT